MRLLSRALFTLALLGGLGFGSYAFGKYVLSSRLFGNKGSKLNQNFGESAVPRVQANNQAGKSGKNASASVEILPDGGSETVTRPASARVNAPDAPSDSFTLNEPISDSTGDSNSTADSNSDSGAAPRRARVTADASEARTSDERPRKRRKKRRARPTPAPRPANAREEPVRQNNTTQPDVIISDDGSQTSPSGENSPAPSAERIEPRRETSDSNDTPSEARPRRRRRIRVPVEEAAPRERERVRIGPRRETPRQESPVPRPEGSGGESPVPIPE